LRVLDEGRCEQDEGESLHGDLLGLA